MKTFHAILALTFATLLITAFSFAAEPEIEVKRHIKLKIATGDDMIDVDADDLAVGETRQSFTESGKEVLLTRLDEGFKLEVDGKEIDLGLTHGEGHGAHKEVFHFSGDSEDAKVMIRTMGGEEGHKYAFIHADGDEDMHWVQEGEGAEDVNIFIERFSPADHLLESGVLDDVDEETREKILATLRDMEPHKRIQKKIIVDVEEKIHQEHDDEN